MNFVLFCHSVESDWNNGNAHFLRGIVRELTSMGHQVQIYEPADGWSRSNLVADFTPIALEVFRQYFPDIRPRVYNPQQLDLEQALENADVVLVHEWNEPALVSRIGRHRLNGGRFHLLFHDTHHRSQTVPEQMAAYDLTGYDGVLAFGEVIRDLYLRRGWIERAWTWHEAADVRLFKPTPSEEPAGDLVWIGNWGDDERAGELIEFLVDPVASLGLKARIHGVRYPQSALSALQSHGIEYRGWLANHRVPAIFGQFALTVHVPRRPYAQALPGIPTIRVFEALACGIPLISAPWEDSEGLFRPGTDYLVARDGREMRQHLQDLMNNPAHRAQMARNGLERILERHTCRHRVQELLGICRELEGVRGADDPVRGKEVAGWK